MGGNKFSSNAAKNTAGYPKSDIQEDIAFVIVSNMLSFPESCVETVDAKVVE
jgi:hypothetical protein